MATLLESAGYQNIRKIKATILKKLLIVRLMHCYLNYRALFLKIFRLATLPLKGPVTFNFLTTHSFCFEIFKILKILNLLKVFELKLRLKLNIISKKSVLTLVV